MKDFRNLFLTSLFAALAGFILGGCASTSEAEPEPEHEIKTAPPGRTSPTRMAR